MNIYLLGSTGFIGSAIKRRLGAAAHTIWAHNRDMPLEQLKWSAICHADIVINAAGNTENEATFVQDNIDLAVEVARCCAAFKKPLIHIGSMMELYPHTAYAQSKLAATEAILAQDVVACVVRAATVYGHGDKPTAFIPTLWRTWIESKPFVCRQDSRAWVHVDDLAHVVTGIIPTVMDPNYGMPATLNVGGDPILNETIVHWMEEALGRQMDNVTFTPGRVYPFASIFQGRSMRDWITDGVAPHLYPEAWVGAEL